MASHSNAAMDECKGLCAIPGKDRPARRRRPLGTPALRPACGRDVRAPRQRGTRSGHRIGAHPPKGGAEADRQHHGGHAGAGYAKGGLGAELLGEIAVQQGP